MQENLSAGLGDEEKSGAAFNKEKYTFGRVSLVYDHRLDEKPTLGCGRQNHIAIGCC
jgi:hypothetical protein